MNLKINENKKVIKGVLVGMVIGGIVFGGIGVAAVNLTADQVKYTPSDSEFNVTNAKQALDEIYKKTEKIQNNNLIPFSFNIITQSYYSSNPTVPWVKMYGTITIGNESKDIDISISGYGQNKEISYTFSNGIEIYAYADRGASQGATELFIKDTLPYRRIAGFLTNEAKENFVENKHGYLVKTDMGYAIIYGDL